MVEFRQSYIGPNMRRYGNMFRVTDCPNSAVRNRVGIIDLRLLSGRTAVHCDPLMWHLDEAPELTAIQIISSIFSTIQISVKLEESTDEMRKMLRFWVGFMKEHKELLQTEQIRPLEPHNLYPVVWTVDEARAVYAVYTENRVISLAEEVKDYIILNGTKGMRMILESGLAGTFEITVKDCMGEVTGTFAHEGPMDLLAVTVPVAGQIYITRK